MNLCTNACIDANMDRTEDDKGALVAVPDSIFPDRRIL